MKLWKAWLKEAIMIPAPPTVTDTTSYLADESTVGVKVRGLSLELKDDGSIEVMNANAPQAGAITVAPTNIVAYYTWPNRPDADKEREKKTEADRKATPRVKVG